jgi:aerobic carbon-monoxide dehydrogenase medium subunit
MRPKLLLQNLADATETTRKPGSVKPAPFEYHRPTSVPEAVEAMAQLSEEDEVKVLAGGQSLVPLMNMRLARPGHVVDLGAVPGLDTIELRDGWLRLGSMVRQRHAELDATVAASNPLLVEAIRHIAHFQIRERGTVGGSVAHADPAAELPLMCCLHEAELTVRGPGGSRRVAASDFFRGFLTTDLEENELLTEVAIPALAPGEGWGFHEFSRRAGDFALVAVAATMELAGDRCSSVRLAFTGAGSRPHVDVEAAALLQGGPVASGAIARAVDAAVEGLAAVSDIHATAQDRKAIARHLGIKALEDAAGRARQRSAIAKGRRDA